MKKFFRNTLLISLPIIILIVFSLICDPFNVFHYKNIRDNGIAHNWNYIKMRYILDNPARFDSYIFGSSRVGFINTADIPGLNCYNMTYPEGLPIEHKDNLEVMIKKNIIPSVVMIGLDDVGCYVDPELHYDNLSRIPYPKNAVKNETAYYKFFLNYFKPEILKSIPIIFPHKGNNLTYRKQFYENGGYPLGVIDQEKTNWENIAIYSLPFNNYGIEKVIADIQSIIDLCNRNNIKLILFTNPLHKLLYQKAVKNGYIDFLSRLSEITDYYNFSGINDVTVNDNNFFNVSHYGHKVGNLIIDTIFNDKTDPDLLSQGFGYYVTAENKNEFISLLLNSEEQ